MSKRVMEKGKKPIEPRSIQLLLDTAQQEYGNEHDRTATIDSKAGIALPILSAYFLAFTQMNNYKEIFAMPMNDFGSALIPVTLCVSCTSGLLLALIAVGMMAKVLFAKNYYRIDPVDLYKDEYLSQEADSFSIKMMQLYFRAISFNRNANNSRIKLYQRSWLLTFISVICYVVYMVVKNNL